VYLIKLFLDSGLLRHTLANGLLPARHIGAFFFYVLFQLRQIFCKLFSLKLYFADIRFGIGDILIYFPKALAVEKELVLYGF
jgi:hypothetical protein